MKTERAYDRHVLRRQFLAMVTRRQRPGAGSALLVLNRREMVMDWWIEADRALRLVPHAVGGAVAANAYAPERNTRDIDLVVLASDADRAGEALRAAGWRQVSPLVGVNGSSWRDAAGHDLDLIEVVESWGRDAIGAAQSNVIEGMPTLTLPYLVWMKLAASRTIDLADVSRMLGRASQAEVDAARSLVARLGSREDIADFDRLVRMGRIEYGDESAGREDDR